MADNDGVTADDYVGLGLRFQVEVDDHDLGTWSKCDGLGVEYEVQEYKEGGENGFVHRLRGRAKYQNIKLTRFVDKQSGDLAKWVGGIKQSVTRGTAHITLVNSEGSPLVTWNLDGAYPVKWNGPSLDGASGQVATESLELAHNGFLSAGG
jgi:phage tail-like protein